MESINWTQVIVAFAAPLLGFLGIVVQCVFAKRQKEDKKEQTEQINKQIAANTAQLEANNQTLAELKKQLSANDVVTVSVVRQNIRRMYYELLPHKVISVVDYRALNEMYNAYKAVTLPDGHHPNSWCDALYEEMSDWEKVEVYPSHLAYLNEPKTNKKGKK